MKKPTIKEELAYLREVRTLVNDCAPGPRIEIYRKHVIVVSQSVCLSHPPSIGVSYVILWPEDVAGEDKRVHHSNALGAGKTIQDAMDAAKDHVDNIIDKAA